MSFPSDIFERMFTDKNTQLLYPKEEIPRHDVEDIVQTNIFNVMLNRRSQRKFENRDVEEWKLDMIFAAADTAPTAGGFQGFEIYHIKNQEVKNKLVQAANNQPYVNAPVVMVFCMNPDRIKLNFSPDMIRKFSQQDATLAAAYSQLAAHALGLSSIWIGMLDENRIRELLGTDLLPSSILCVGYPIKMLIPKPKRNLKDLIHEI
ncbi:MAG TPA: nitroreductase family protein [Nitrososphaeraceae archaeon]|nr:nitroreductase family protein [Nitrososphaeraceae archaeon]